MLRQILNRREDFFFFFPLEMHGRMHVSWFNNVMLSDSAFVSMLSLLSGSLYIHNVHSFFPCHAYYPHWVRFIFYTTLLLELLKGKVFFKTWWLFFCWKNLLQFLMKSFFLINFSINSHFCFWMCNLLTNVSMKDENTKFSPRKYKKCDKYIRPLTLLHHH